MLFGWVRLSSCQDFIPCCWHLATTCQILSGWSYWNYNFFICLIVLCFIPNKDTKNQIVTIIYCCIYGHRLSNKKFHNEHNNELINNISHLYFENVTEESNQHLIYCWLSSNWKITNCTAVTLNFREYRSILSSYLHWLWGIKSCSIWLYSSSYFPAGSLPGATPVMPW